MATMKEILKAAKTAKAAATKAEKAAAAEKAQRTLDAIAKKACDNAKGWLANEPERLEADIRNFFQNKTAKEALLDGIGVFFGRNDFEPQLSKDYGPYVISLEDSIPGSHYPTVMKVNVRTNIRVAKFLANRLGVKKEELDRNAIESLLLQESGGHLLVRFVPVEELEKAPADAELIELGTLEVDGLEIFLTALPTVNGSILVNRSDWYKGAKYAPSGELIDFDLWHVYVPKAE